MQRADNRPDCGHGVALDALATAEEPGVIGRATRVESGPENVAYYVSLGTCGYCVRVARDWDLGWKYLVPRQ